MNNSQQFEGTPSEGRTFSWGRVWLGCWTFVGVVLLLISISSAPMAVGKPAGAEECATIYTKEKAGSVELLPTQLTAPKFTKPNWQAANIEDIKAGDWVMAQDPETVELAPKGVKEAYRRVVDHLQIVTIADEDGKVVQEFRTTAEHPFWVAGNGWVKAKELKPGSKVLQADGKHGKVVSNIREPHPEGYPVYNFQVDGFHTYFVVARGSRGPPVLVHNNNVCPNLIQIGKAINSLTEANATMRANLPNGMTLGHFGRQVMQWGTGHAAARARIGTLTAQQLRSAGITAEMADNWARAYEAISRITPNNPSAAGRADLMRVATQLLRGE